MCVCVCAHLLTSLYSLRFHGQKQCNNNNYNNSIKINNNNDACVHNTLKNTSNISDSQTIVMIMATIIG